MREHAACACGGVLFTATVTTHHPDHYVLVNEHDGTRWRIGLGPNGNWVRERENGSKADPS